MKKQVVQNCTARFFLGKPKRKRVSILINDCKWLLSNQFVEYHTFLVLGKLISFDPKSLLCRDVTHIGHGYLKTAVGIKLIAVSKRS